MRRGMSAVVLSVAVLLPRVGNAQAGLANAQQFGSPLPQVTAAGVAWQVNDEPILVQGLVYYPTREFRIFDSNVMMPIGSYERVPVYADATLAPFSVVYVPVGGATMRSYEYRRQGALAGTTGSRNPAGSPVVAPATTPTVEERPVGTAGVVAPSVVVAPVQPATRSASARRRTPPVQTTLRPQGRNGIWIEYAGTRWYSEGEAAVFSPDRFTQIGEYRGFPVYRANDDAKKDRIWVTSATDGPVAPFVKQ